MPYKISGNISEDCNIKIFQGNDYIGYQEVTGSSHDTVFDLTSSGIITAVAENSSGRVVGYGNVTPISTGDPVTVSGGSISSIIKSVQYGSVVSTNLTDVFAITEVDLDNAMLIYTGQCEYDADRFAAIKLTSPTELTSYRTWTGASTVGYSIVEFQPGVVKSAQRGHVSAGTTTTQDVSISAVNRDKSHLSLTGFNGYPGSYGKAARAWFLDDSTIRINFAYKAAWQVIEFE